MPPATFSAAGSWRRWTLPAACPPPYTHIERVGRTSMTLRVEAWAQRYLTPAVELVTFATFVMVALGPDGRPSPVPEDR